MSKRNKSPNPNDPTQWIGQPYVPQQRFSSLWWAWNPLYAFFLRLFKHPNKQGCSLVFLLVGIIVLTWAGLFAIGLIAASGLSVWIVGALALAAAVIVVGCIISARRIQRARKAQRHHKRHAAHRHS